LKFQGRSKLAAFSIFAIYFELQSAPVTPKKIKVILKTVRRPRLLY
jgi:hypothetical protein